ncbi:hypothetical protein DM02DRAFT_561917 [Periconia macrospinosa]|uniref:Rhodopsin domain-containing protein n=1 Tax=Periconia macrospinosa TaxID=97972 RepID=A0A2V1DSL7_9PLEO|nr:hypothetical protein DM02DRAFT_561917 [Periconia macrospinosa]
MAGTGLQPLNFFLILFPFIISAAVVSVRVWRRALSHQLAIEDWLIIIAEVLLAALTAGVWKIVLVSYSGYHAADIPKGAVNLTEVLLWRWINNVMYNPILGLVKISFCITLLKLRSPKVWAKVSLWFLIAVNSGFIIAATVAHIFSCTPIQKAWDKQVPGTCVDRKPYIYGVISVTIATDVLVTIIPAALLHDLQMSRRSKISVIVFLSLPLAVTAIAIYRLQNFVVVLNLPPGKPEDPYNVRNSLSNIESNLGVLAACGPTIKWILERIFPCVASGSTRPTKQYNYTPSKPSRMNPSNQGYQKSMDVELTVTGKDYGHSTSFIRATDEDARSDEQAITKGGGVQKTVTVEWNVDAVGDKGGDRNTTGKTAEPHNYV